MEVKLTTIAAAISDDDSDGVPDEIPAKAAKMVAEPAADEEEEEDEDDDDEVAAEDEYRVEKIIKHDFDGSTTIYQIKWLGWNKASDLTWEPVENLSVQPLERVATGS